MGGLLLFYLDYVFIQFPNEPSDVDEAEDRNMQQDHTSERDRIHKKI